MEVAVEIDPHGEVEILLALAADDRGQVEHRNILAVDQPGDGLLVGNVAGLDLDAFVVEPGDRLGGQCHVEQQDLLDRLRLARGAGERAQRQKSAGPIASR